MKEKVILLVNEGKSYEEIEAELRKDSEYTEEEIEAGLLLAKVQIEQKERDLAYKLFNVY